MLGVTESPAYPAATKTLAEWFPRKERAFAMGVVNAGASIGSIAAPLLVGALAADKSVDSLCLHGDTPGAAELARALRTALTDAGLPPTAFTS